MLRTVRRVATLASCGAVLIAIYSFAAQAAPTKPSATTLPATDVKASSAVLNGSIKTHGQATEWRFKWGKSTNFGNSTPLQTIPSGQGQVHVSAKITGLKANTTYFFRLIATSGFATPQYAETSKGATLHFKSAVSGKKISRKPKKHRGFTG